MVWPVPSNSTHRKVSATKVTSRVRCQAHSYNLKVYHLFRKIHPKRIQSIRDIDPYNRELEVVISPQFLVLVVFSCESSSPVSSSSAAGC